MPSTARKTLLLPCRSACLAASVAIARRTPRRTPTGDQSVSRTSSKDSREWQCDSGPEQRPGSHPRGLNHSSSTAFHYWPATHVWVLVFCALRRARLKLQPPALWARVALPAPGEHAPIAGARRRRGRARAVAAMPPAPHGPRAAAAAEPPPHARDRGDHRPEDKGGEGPRRVEHAHHGVRSVQAGARRPASSYQIHGPGRSALVPSRM